MKIYFEYPAVLLLLILMPLYWMWYYGWYDPRRLYIALSYDPRKLLKINESWKQLRLLPNIMMWTACVLMVLGLARPRQAEGLFDKTTEGNDVFLLLDTSASMETTDMLPNRMYVAQKTANDFVQKSKNDRFGVIVFAQDAFAYVPLTMDHSFVQTQISDLSTEILPKEGTALGSAMVVGINRLKESKSNGSKVMILITDGVHNTGMIDPINAAMLAASYDIKIYPIGIGKEQFINPEGKEVKTELDEETLQRIAQITGSQFFRADNQYTLQEALYAVGKLEKGRQSEPHFKQIHDRYNWFLVSALVLLLAAYGLKFTGYYNTLEG